MKNGMGMSDLKLGAKTFYGHGGSTDGFRTLLVYLPEEILAIAYTSNGMVYPPQNILRGVVEIYQSKPFEIPTFESIAVSSEILEKYVGVYPRPGSPLKVTITRDATTLHAQTTGQSAFPLEATAADKFKSERAGNCVGIRLQKIK